MLGLCCVVVGRLGPGARSSFEPAADALHDSGAIYDEFHPFRTAFRQFQTDLRPFWTGFGLFYAHFGLVLVYFDAGARLRILRVEQCQPEPVLHKQVRFSIAFLLLFEYFCVCKTIFRVFSE